MIQGEWLIVVTAPWWTPDASRPDQRRPDAATFAPLAPRKVSFISLLASVGPRHQGHPQHPKEFMSMCLCGPSADTLCLATCPVLNLGLHVLYSNIVGVAATEAGAEACKAKVGDLGMDQGGEEVPCVVY